VAGQPEPDPQEKKRKEKKKALQKATMQNIPERFQ
jgi:hypothetical protein